MRCALVLVLFSILPLSVYADIGNSSSDPASVQMVLHNTSARQILGTGISGTATSFEFFIEQRRIPAGYTQRPEVIMWECTDEAYIDCSQTTLLSLNLGNTDRPLMKRAYSIEYSFNSNRFYILEFAQSGTNGNYYLGASVENTYENGACSSGRSLSQRNPCRNSNDSSQILSDITFLIKGVEQGTRSGSAPVETPIIFLPGIFGSKLYIGEERIWDGLAGDRMKRLALDENGKSVHPVRVGETLFQFSAFNLNLIDVYQALKDYFTCSGSFSSSITSKIPGNEDVTCDTPLITYPYDWRYDVFDILENGTTYTNGETVRLAELVEHLADNPTGKVHIIAHSNGGLLAKALMIRLEELGKENLVDTIVLVASPQLGTPSAITAMLHGHAQTMLGGSVKKADVTRMLSINSPGIYSLLPSRAYIEKSEPLLAFDNSFRTQPYRNTYGEFIDSYEEFIRFLTNSDSLRNVPNDADLNAPTVLNKKLLEKADATHKRIDNWAPSEETRFVQIIGIGNQTVKRLSYSTGLEFDLDGIGRLKPIPRTKLWYRPVRTAGGDSEVIAQASELGIGETYYFDLEKLFKETTRVRDHSNIFSEKEILVTLEKIFSDKSVESPFITLERDAGLDERIKSYTIISLYSPVVLSVEDLNGNISQITYDDASDLFNITEGIPGSFVEFVGEAKYIYLPKETPYTVAIRGIDAGSFDLAISESNESGVIQELHRFENIPVKKSSQASLSVSSEGVPSSISLDINTDGESDYIFSLTGDAAEILLQLEEEIISLPIRTRLKSIFLQYFDLLEVAENEEDRANYTAQIKRLIRYLNGRYISQDTADTWTALAEHLQ